MYWKAPAPESSRPTTVVARRTVSRRSAVTSPREHFLRVALIVLGPELTRLAYPDAVPLIFP